VPALTAIVPAIGGGATGTKSFDATSHKQTILPVGLKVFAGVTCVAVRHGRRHHRGRYSAPISTMFAICRARLATTDTAFRIH
jgi:hypothetical protein